jgi:hypothetical protein
MEWGWIDSLRNMVTTGSISLFVRRQRSLMVGRQQGADPLHTRRRHHIYMMTPY